MLDRDSPKSSPASQTLSVNSQLWLERSPRTGFQMLFRLGVVTVVLGLSLFLSYVASPSWWNPAAMALFAAIAGTYGVTLILLLLLQRGAEPRLVIRMGIIADLIFAAALLHLTGGAQSAYSFLFPLVVLEGIFLEERRSTMTLFWVVLIVFAGTCFLGWVGVLPVAQGQRLLPWDLSSYQFSRLMLLNTSAILGAGLLVISFSRQRSASLEQISHQQKTIVELAALNEDIVHSIDNPLLAFDDKERLIFYNRSAHEFFGDLNEGQALSALFPTAKDVFGELPPRLSLREYEVDAEIKGQERSMAVSVTPLRGEASHGKLVYVRDISEVKELESRMRQNERLAVLGQLTAAIAHEIRNPLTSIGGAIELLHREEGGDERLVKIVDREVGRLEKLLTELLEYSNPSPRERVRFDIVQLVRDVLESFQAGQGRHEIAADLPDKSLFCIGDPGRLRQAVWNILQNAVQASGDKGVLVNCEEGRETIRIAIRDQGPGISNEVLERIFEPFMSTKQGGTGLGLAVAHAVIEEHQGTLHAENVSGGGAVFTLQLPSAHR